MIQVVKHAVVVMANCEQHAGTMQKFRLNQMDVYDPPDIGLIPMLPTARNVQVCVLYEMGQIQKTDWIEKKTRNYNRMVHANAEIHIFRLVKNARLHAIRIEELVSMNTSIPEPRASMC